MKIEGGKEGVHKLVDAPLVSAKILSKTLTFQRQSSSFADPVRDILIGLWARLPESLANEGNELLDERLSEGRTDAMGR